MRERPILFSDEMVRAILDGRKTETRRVVKPELPTWEQAGDRYGFRRARSGRFVVTGSVELVRRAEVRLFGRSRLASVATRGLRSPYGAPGDLLYVQETWATGKTCDEMSPKAIGAAAVEAGWSEPWAPILYRADGHYNRAVWPSEFRQDWGGNGKWRPSIHMPKWASRIWLRVAEVRIERLQEITDSGALAEGVDRTNTSLPGYARARFEALWNSIYGGDESWSSDPWVWVVRFEVVSTTGRPQ